MGKKIDKPFYLTDNQLEYMYNEKFFFLKEKEKTIYKIRCNFVLLNHEMGENCC
jgi:hypothetical protein